MSPNDFALLGFQQAASTAGQRLPELRNRLAMLEETARLRMITGVRDQHEFFVLNCYRHLLNAEIALAEAQLAWFKARDEARSAQGLSHE